MKLYHQARTRSVRVRWLLAELGVRHDVETIDVYTGEGRRPEYQKVHPHGFVPALEDEARDLITHGAIVFFKAQTRFDDAKEFFEDCLTRENFNAAAH